MFAKHPTGYSPRAAAYQIQRSRPAITIQISCHQIALLKREPNGPDKGGQSRTTLPRGTWIARFAERRQSPTVIASRQCPSHHPIRRRRRSVQPVSATWRCFVNKVLRTLLRTGLYFLEQSDRATADLRDQLRDRVGHITNRTREAMGMEPDHTVRDAMSFVAGVGLGLGMGLLFAPASGRETRDLISEKVREAGSKVRESFSQEMQRAS